MTSFFVPKSRKVKFEATCHVHDLTNLPYVSGLYFVKWKLKNGGSYEGLTHKVVVKEHVASWDCTFRLEPTMIIGKDGVLLPCELILYIRQSVNAGKSTEDIGMVSINLAEYAASRSTSRRYLLQESRVNSIIKVTIEMKLVKGDPVYKVPEVSKRDLSSESIRGIFSEEGREDHSMYSLSSLEDPKSVRQSQVHPLLSQGDDPNVDLVNRLFATTTSQGHS
ncbi:uncharacterized protein SPPG_00416 [Spizellomyces punctatus DAOM BR117]|uniref:C2 NT-type domain-containing protein n=1 Tax=Spizellomyces punctatus (strain DAOM BR117) TaxID=645134 RepID=A0A0L0HUE5_SPIPD|nr:uncharacterized protein SPPG_00416 [Spizellomyces punctatus DAOM BR117]KND04707.1 hypothetical protein SPPG_00416 [Spizellomyces punctatus DAOM BR117]|eukprot:XP_016612746.1 hypothetical protein SPPG_00416 [Spizellomyces punctatus DAOM BR117]